MLSMADTDINLFIPTFAQSGVPVAFLVPTPTGYGKSIMDATSPVRTLLLNEHIHDYSKQGQGQNEKKQIRSCLIYKDHIVSTTASLYRPITKKGDPRIWFSGLRNYCKPCNLLALFVVCKHICVINLSDPAIAASLFNGGFVYSILQEAANEKTSVARELLKKIKDIHNQGYLPSITSGDPGVGDTLEHALGISRNNSKQPDYKGIELKASRLTRAGAKKPKTRVNLFSKVPDEGLTYRQILANYGKLQIPRGHTTPRFQIECTLQASQANSYGLLIAMENNNEKLDLLSHNEDKTNKFVSAWVMENLQQQLLTKHHETFWVKANAIQMDSREYFRYDYILHTKNPNASLFGPLVENDKITVDLLAYLKPDGNSRDHGCLFKMKPDDLPLLFGKPAEYDLNKDISTYLDAMDDSAPAYVAEQAADDYTSIVSSFQTPTL